MGATHFLTKGLERVKAEMSLHVLAYNFRRLMAILGTGRMLEAIRPYARYLTLQALLEVLSVLVLLKIPKWVCEARNASSSSRTDLCPYNSAPSPSF